MQYSYFSVILGPLMKQCFLFEIFFHFSPPPPPFNPIQSWDSETILDARVQHRWWGEGRGWACVNWKTPQKCKSVPRLLSMSVVLFGYSTLPYCTIQWVSFHNGSRNLDCYPWLYYFIVSVAKFNMLHTPCLFALCYRVGFHTCLPASLKSVSGFSNGIFDGDGTSFHHQTPNLESQVL